MAIPGGRTTPRFLLTGNTEVIITRKAQGSYVDGVWVEGIEEDIPIIANVQPYLVEKQLLILPESDRIKDWINIWSVSEIRTGQEGPGGWEADLVNWEGKVYKVMKVHHFAMGVLDHYKAWAAAEPVSAL